MRWGLETPKRSAARCVVSCWFSGIRTIARPNCMLRTMSLSSRKTAPGSSSRSPSAPTRAGDPSWSIRLSSRIWTSSDSGNATGSCSMVAGLQHRVYHANEINALHSNHSKTTTPPSVMKKRGQSPRFPQSASLSPNLQQLDFENQRGSARNRGRVAVVPVRDVGRAHQPGLSTYLHLLHAFGPAFNHAAQRELRGLIALVRAVKLRSVDQCAPIVHLHRIGGLRRGAGSGLDVPVDQSGLCLERARLRDRLCQIRLGGGLLLLRHAGRAGLPERL